MSTTEVEHREDREHADKISDKTGLVIWITGLSGAGKSSIAKKTQLLLSAAGKVVVRLDGDEFREVLGNNLSHNTEDRIKNAYSIARMCKLLALQNVNVLCATMSLYPEIWEWNRQNIQRYLEVYIKAPRNELERRDPKGIYERVHRGLEKNVIGIDLPFHEPTGADLVIENNLHDLARIDEHAERLFKLLSDRI